jgi:hypothetical protein
VLSHSEGSVHNLGEDNSETISSSAVVASAEASLDFVDELDEVGDERANESGGKFTPSLEVELGEAGGHSCQVREVAVTKEELV